MESLQNYSLCDRCSSVDLSPLTAPLPVSQESHRDPATVYEEQLAVYIPDFQLDHAKRNSQCRLCNLLAVCAHRSGEEHTLHRKAVCIRPKLVWLADVSDASSGGARLFRTGQLHVWFHEIKKYLKRVPAPLWGPSTLIGGPSNRRENASDEGQRLSHEEMTLGDLEDSRRRLLWQLLGFMSSFDQSSDTSDETGDESDDDQTSEDEDLNFRHTDLVFAEYGLKLMSLDENGQQLLARLLARHLNSTRRIMIKSAVASWMLDIAQQDNRLSDCKRVPISRLADTTMIRNWLVKCDGSHSHLPSAGDSSSRINQIISRRLLRVINTSTGDIATLSSLANFVALSYVWGIKRVQEQSLKSLPITAYAATIRDAATLAQSLGFEWLWVDRICINQDNDDEKPVLIPYMKDIYAAASLTIVAASGDGAHSGLPGAQHTTRQEETPLRIDPPNGNILQLLPALPSFNTLLNSSAWRTRGWTFEEEVFSRRLLYVFPTEIFFNCNKGTYRESTAYKFVPEPAGSTWADFGATPPLVAAELSVAMQQRERDSLRLLTTRQYVRAVEEYTSRDLTKEEDRVGAFAGLIMASIDVDDDVSEVSLLKHGQPLSFFETALTWQPTENNHMRHQTYGEPSVPSWSWASAGCKVHFLDNGEEYNKSNWFQFGILGDFDVLGLPSQNILQGKRGMSPQTNFLKNLNLDFPTELINSMPWLEDVSSGSPGSIGVMASTDMSMNICRVRPTLHLTSVVFEAIFKNASEGLHRLESLDGHAMPVTGHWAIASGFLSGRQKFAIVAGNSNICIMALKQESSEGTFSRMGLLRVSWYGSTSLFSIMRQGNARWEYIRLI